MDYTKRGDHTHWGWGGVEGGGKRVVLRTFGWLYHHRPNNDLGV